VRTALKTAARRRTAASGFLAALVVLAILVAGCGSSAPSAATGGSQPPSSPASPAGKTPGAGSPGTAGGSANAARACATTALKAVLVPASGAAGSAYAPIRFSNVSRTRCALSGYPGVSFVTGPSGSQIGSAANRIPLPAGPARAVTLAPGAFANAVLQIADPGNYPKSRCQPASAPYLRVYPPGQTEALYLKNASGFGACASADVTTLHIEPVEPGASPPGGG
jgi:hypothetical protein